MLIMSELPLPEIEDIEEHSFKQFNQKKDVLNNSKKPPKLYPKHDLSFNKKAHINSSIAHMISFQENYGTSPLYQKDNKNQSYYEQCFEQISKIGEGSFAEVFKVKSKQDGQYYAIKKSKQSFRGEFYRQERLEEVKRYEQFSKHEHCVKLYKAWEQDELLYMQMELCKCSLDVYVAEKKVIPESMVWSILLDLLLALKSLHDQNLIHLDIKLENMLITDDDICKLGDFGLVINLKRDNLHLTTEGDSRYVAPELMLGEFSKAADIFSLGIAILELASNLDLPTNGPLWHQLRGGILQDCFFKMLSSNLKEIITWMMAPDSKSRPTVDTLLLYPKLQSMHNSRLKWVYLRKTKNISRQIIRNLIRKFYDFLKFFSNKYNWIIERISLKPREVILDESIHFDESLIHSTPNFMNGMYQTPGLSRIANSTPINRNHLGFSHLRKNRNDIPRVNLSLDSSDDDQISQTEYTPLINSIKLNYSVESTGYIGKKLFFKAEDSD